MKMIVTGLPETLPEDLQINGIGPAYLHVLHMLGVPVNGVKVTFEADGTPS